MTEARPSPGAANHSHPPQIHGQALGSSLWESGTLLAEFFVSPEGQKMLEGKGRALELGCGVGLPGLALALLPGRREVPGRYEPQIRARLGTTAQLCVLCLWRTAWARGLLSSCLLLPALRESSLLPTAASMLM